MGKTINFNGFSRQAVGFFSRLKENNTKEWFDENKKIYEQEVLAPARSFVEAMGRRLQQEISPDIVAIPKMNQSIFRIYRDTRFSVDKTPYKTHLGIYFWQGRGKKLENSGFYFHLEPQRLMLGAGVYMFPRHLLPVYRQAIADPQLVLELEEAVGKIKRAGNYSVGGKHYKRIPPGYEVPKEYQHYLLHNGLWASADADIPGEINSEALVGYCLQIFKHLQPLHNWLLNVFSEVM